MLRSFAFAAGFALIVAALYALAAERYESPQIRSDRRNLARMTTGTLLVLGSSHGFNLLPKEMGFEGVNLAHGGQDGFEMGYMARAVKRASPNLRTVVFTLSYFTFFFDNAAYLQGGRNTRIGRRVGMYSAFRSFPHIPGDGTSFVKGVLYPVVTSDHWKSLLWPSPSDAPAYVKASGLPPNSKGDKQVASESSIATHARRRCSQYKKLIRNMTSHHENLDDDVYAFLRNVSGELEDAGVRVVLVIPAYYETYNACFDAKRQAQTRRLAKRLAKETGAELIDAGTEPEFSNNSEFFSNSDHMNRNGKVAFSRWLGRRLAGRARAEPRDAEPSRAPRR